MTPVGLFQDSPVLSTGVRQSTHFFEMARTNYGPLSHLIWRIYLSVQIMLYPTVPQEEWWERIPSKVSNSMGGFPPPIGNSPSALGHATRKEDHLQWRRQQFTSCCPIVFPLREHWGGGFFWIFFSVALPTHFWTGWLFHQFLRLVQTGSLSIQFLKSYSVDEESNPSQTHLHDF